jgi:hypothetical protein
MTMIRFMTMHDVMSMCGLGARKVASTGFLRAWRGILAARIRYAAVVAVLYAQAGSGPAGLH